MATVKKITMREYNGTDYDTLYPKTVAAQIDDVYSKDETYSKSQLYTQSQLYTKTQVLTDATKTLYGLNSSAVPNDVLAILGKLNSYYWWRKYSGTPTSYTLGNVGTFSKAANTGFNIYYSNNVNVNRYNGKVTLAEPITTANLPLSDINTSKSILNSIKGKFFVTSKTGEAMYRTNTDATNNSDYVYAEYQKVVGQAESVGAFIEYVTSNNRNSYPYNGWQNGYLYVLHGIPFDNAINAAKMATGGYVGTGSTTTLNFEFNLEFIFIATEDGSSTSFSFVDNDTTQFSSVPSNAGTTYRYIAIGH